MTTTRRHFLQSTASAAAATAALPAVMVPAVATASKTDTRIVLGEGDYRYEVQHDWPQLPNQYSWQTTHNVAVDSGGNLYVIHEGREDQKDHPSIFVFDAEGKFVRAFGNQFQGGGHGLEVRKEGNEEFLYVSAYQQVKAFAKLSLRGETVWSKRAPMESKAYAAGEDTDPKKIWGRDRFMPTNFAFLDDGGFLLADGYGSFQIHRYDKNANWVSSFGGPGAGEGKFDTPHGIWIDRRPGRTPSIVVCDRAHHTLQYLTMEGKHLETMPGFGLPANVDTHQDLMVVPELVARLTLLNSKNEVVARLGEDVDRLKADGKFEIRGNRERWQVGKFVHPHDACFDPQGNLFVAEWVATGRITRLKRLA